MVCPQESGISVSNWLAAPQTHCCNSYLLQQLLFQLSLTAASNTYNVMVYCSRWQYWVHCCSEATSLGVQLMDAKPERAYCNNSFCFNCLLVQVLMNEVTSCKIYCQCYSKCPTGSRAKGAFPSHCLPVFTINVYGCLFVAAPTGYSYCGDL